MQDVFDKKIPPMNQMQQEELKRHDRVIAMIGIVVSAIALPLMLAAIFGALGVLVLALKWLIVVVGG